MTVIFQEDSTDAPINLLINQLLEANWYHQVGLKDIETEIYIQEFLSQLNVEEYELKWVNKENLKEMIGLLSLRDSIIWKELKDVPDQLKEKIDAKNKNAHLEKLIDFIPEAVFHPAFDNAFNHFREEKIVCLLTGIAMYLATLICTAELGGEGELFEPILKIIENGHVPIGLKGNVIYLI